jgi:hypothetical protein
MTSLLEALSDYYDVHFTSEEMVELQENRTRSTDTAPMGTEVPSRAQNRIQSGRASRRSAQNRRDLEKVGGVAGHWTRAALKPSDYHMCKVR